MFFVYNQRHISNYQKYRVKRFQRSQNIWLFATKNILRLRFSKRKKTGSLMFVYGEGFLQGVWTLLSFTVHSTENCFVPTAGSFVYVGVPDIGMSRGPKTPTDPPHFLLIYKPFSCIFWHTMSPVHTFFCINKLNLFCSTSPISVTLTIGVLERKTQLTVFALHDFFKEHLSRVTQIEWFIFSNTNYKV